MHDEFNAMQSFNLLTEQVFSYSMLFKSFLHELFLMQKHLISFCAQRVLYAMQCKSTIYSMHKLFLYACMQISSLHRSLQCKAKITYFFNAQRVLICNEGKSANMFNAWRLQCNAKALISSLNTFFRMQCNVKS